MPFVCLISLLCWSSFILSWKKNTRKSEKHTYESVCKGFLVIIRPHKVSEKMNEPVSYWAHNMMDYLEVVKGRSWDLVENRTG